jgi:toxin YoeB
LENEIFANQFILSINKEASRDFDKIRSCGDKGMIIKLEQIIHELSEHPDTGIGRPEPLKHHLSGY